MEIKLFLSKIHYFETKISFSISYLNIYEIQEYFNFKSVEYIDNNITNNIVNEHSFIYRCTLEHKSYDYYNPDYKTFKYKIDNLWKY